MSNQHCFHCGLPVVEKKPPLLEIENHQQAFCCHGCLAVCDAIISSGNGDYYKHREGKARSFNSTELPELLDKLKLYDNEEIQREFVRTGMEKSRGKVKGEEQNWKEAWLILEEIRCAACLWLNERTLRQLEGVIDVQMDYTGQQARVRWNPDKIKLSDILKAITSIGYNAHPFDPSQRESLNKEQKQRSLQRIIFAILLGMAVMQSAIASYFFGDQNAQGEFPLWIHISRWVSVLSTAAILAYPGQLFFRNAWRDLKNRTLGMDVPVVIGLSVAWLGSLYSTIRQDGDVYFESIAMFVLFLLIARYIELRSRITATALLDRSAKIIPQSAWLVNESASKEVNEVSEIPVIELQAGDVIRLSPGETVPVDGRLLSDQSSFDESLLTGESLPVTHLKGEQIMGGAINVEQVIELEVLSGKVDSTLNEIHQLTQQSVNYRPYYVDLAEQVAGKFVAAILLIAVSTFLFWYGKDSENALSNMIAVLIVTCPCALALAAPVALSLGAAGLNQKHLLAVQMSSIEKLSHVDTIIFDKTGTLTSGTPELKEIISVGDFDKATCLSIAASLEEGSQHPFAKAILEAHETKRTSDNTTTLIENVNVENMMQHPGQGVEADISFQHQNQKEQHRWFLGNESLTRSPAESLNNEELEKINNWRENGYSVLYLSNEQDSKAKLQAVFCIEDPLRDGIQDFLKTVNELGISNKVILSGDHQASVNAVANQLGIQQAFGGLSPQQKLAWVKKHREKVQEENKIMMLGDGINDAPTLAAADVSLTFSEATDLAQSNCDFILLSKDYSHLGSAFKLMRKTRRIILQNLGWAIAYNIIAIPLAVAGFITPWMAAIGMSVSSLIVVLNSLRLR